MLTVSARPNSRQDWIMPPQVEADGPRYCLPAGLSLRIEGRIARLGLHDARRGNLLTLSATKALHATLTVLAGEAAIEAVVLEGEGGLFCSGADLPALYHHLAEDRNEAAREFWRQAAALVTTLARLHKPVIALMDGAVIGGGLALGAYATYRVVTERTRISLPQTAVGLVPDMGTSRLLARAPGGIGAYLGLTGSSISAADAIYAGFADGFIASSGLEALCQNLANASAGSLVAILNAAATAPGVSSLEEASAGLSEAFAQPTVAAISVALGSRQEPWARRAESALRTGSPVAMELALGLIGHGRSLKRIEDGLVAEHRLICKLIESGEAFEGIAARLINSERLPHWLAARPQDVDAAVLEPFLRPLLPGDELAMAAPLDS